MLVSKYRAWKVFHGCTRLSCSQLLSVATKCTKTIADNPLDLFSETGGVVIFGDSLLSFHYSVRSSKNIIFLFLIEQIHGSSYRHTVFLPHLIALAAPHFNSMKLPSITPSTAPCGKE